MPDLSEHTEASAVPGARTILAIGSIITVAFMGSVIVTPLYSLYREKFGFGEITLTLVYAIYVVGNVAALLYAGQISDRIGRKRMVLPALGIAAISALLFLFAQGTAWLFAGRLFIGLAVGVLSGTATAWMAERFGPGRRPTATVAATSANLIGIAIGPLLGGLLAQYVSGPLAVPFLVYLGLLAGVAVAVSRVEDDRECPFEGWSALRVHPRVGVPPAQRRGFMAPAITGFATFAVGGLYFALIPSILIEDLKIDNLAVGGAIVFEFGVVAVALINLCKRVPPSRAMKTGLVFLVPTVALIVIAQAAGSLILLLVATAMAGIPLALGYRGSLEVINEIAPEERRGEIVSSFFIACFLGNALPVIGIGVLSTLTDALAADIVFACLIAVMAMAALAWYQREATVAEAA